MTDLVITNATAVLPDRTIERATVAVRDGLIAEVREGPPPSPGDWPGRIDAAGAWLLPGIVDLHNDGLEGEVNPRPRANLPLPFALGTMEQALVAAGVTTEFHAVAYMERPSALRTLQAAVERSAYLIQVAADRERPVDHRILHRIDVRSPETLDAVFAALDACPLRYASLNDHTPGQGQYRDVDRFISHSHDGRARADPGPSPEEIRARVEAAAAGGETVAGVYRRVRAEAARAPTLLASHDDHTPDKVDEQWALGATIAEFPVTVEAAGRARERGMTVVVGAPNVVRGGSQSGNLAAVELIGLGLADALCADYHAPSLPAAVFRLVDLGLLDLPAAVRMATLTPARAVGLTDRGAIAAGLRADLALVRCDAAAYPRVEATIRGGRPCLVAGTRLASAAMAAPPTQDTVLR